MGTVVDSFKVKDTVTSSKRTITLKTVIFSDKMSFFCLPIRIGRFKGRRHFTITFWGAKFFYFYGSHFTTFCTKKRKW